MQAKDKNDTISPEMIQNQTNEIYLEGMTSVSALIQGIRAGLNGRTIRRILFDKTKMKTKEREFRFLQAVSRELSFEILLCDAAKIDTVVNGSTHGGVVAVCSARPLPSLSDVINNKVPENQWIRKGFLILPEGVEDPYNFGYLLRSVYAAGADGVILPPRNWMSAAGIVARSSAGSSELLPMAVAEPTQVASLLKSEVMNIPYRIICAGIRDSVPLCRANLARPLCLVIGGEKRGISRAVLDASDQTVRIDYGRDFKGSLSAAAATAVMAFEVLRQNPTEK